MAVTATRARLSNLTLRAYIALGVGAVCIGFSAIFTKWAGVPGPVSGFYRVAIATTALALPFAIIMARRRSAGTQHATRGPALERSEGTEHASPRPLKFLLVGTALAGLFFALDLGVWNTSLLYTSAANSTLIGNTSTLWVSIGAVLFFSVRLRRRFWSGMALALTGAVIIVGRDMRIDTMLGWGDLLAVLSSVFYAAYILNTEMVRRRVETLTFMWLSSLAATIFLLGYCLITRLQLTGFPPSTYAALLALGLISHATGWMAINYALGHLAATITSVTLLSQPVFTAVASVFLLSEPLSIYQIGGGVLVLLGIYIVNARRGAGA